MIIRLTALIATLVLAAPMMSVMAEEPRLDFALAPGGGRAGGGGMDRPMLGGGRFGMEDPELAELSLDVFLLRAINEMHLTQEQAGRIVPVLKNAAQMRSRAVAQTKQVLRQVREELLRDTGLGQPRGDPMERVRPIQQEADRAAEQARQTLMQTLNQRQMQILQRVMQSGLPGGPGPEMGPPPGGPMGPGPGGPRPGPAGPGAGGGFQRPGGLSPLIIERLAELLQEKQRYLPR